MISSEQIQRLRLMPAALTTRRRPVINTSVPARAGARPGPPSPASIPPNKTPLSVRRRPLSYDLSLRTQTPARATDGHRVGASLKGEVQGVETSPATTIVTCEIVTNSTRQFSGSGYRPTPQIAVISCFSRSEICGMLWMDRWMDGAMFHVTLDTT